MSETANEKAAEVIRLARVLLNTRCPKSEHCLGVLRTERRKVRVLDTLVIERHTWDIDVFYANPKGGIPFAAVYFNVDRGYTSWSPAFLDNVLSTLRQALPLDALADV